jgi:hypothetical protein
MRILPKTAGGSGNAQVTNAQYLLAFAGQKYIEKTNTQ